MAARADHMMGVHVRPWSDDQRLAWEGLLEVARGLRRGAEEHVESSHGLSVGMLGIMGRLAQTPDNALRLTDLASAMGLSISRISRIIDVLERRELVARRSCPTDARATHIVLLPAGLVHVDRAQATLEAYVRERFVDRVTDDEAATLAGLFARLIDGSPSEVCPGDE